jgi:hypothetical protein
LPLGKTLSFVSIFNGKAKKKEETQTEPIRGKEE